LLIGLLALLLLNQSGIIAWVGASGSTGPSTSGAVLSTGTTLPSPTATSSATATSSVIPLSGWLQVTPSSVQLGCDGDQRTQVVVLANTGPEDVHWQATVFGFGDRVGVTVTPNEGDLDAGNSASVQVQNTTSTSGSHGGSSRQGVIRFAAESADAGTPASLNYTSQRCR